ncbi:MAG: hypothetical protein K6E15_10275 [Prevotella sp.]|nr:hypothetical protein [Prevotella sp.]
MKTRRLMGLLAATMACGLTQISCSKGDTPVIVEEGYSISDEEFAGFNGKVIESGEMTTRAILEDMIEDHMDMQTYDDTIYTDYATSALEQLADANARTRAGEDGEPGSDKMLKLAYTTVRYTTTSVDGSQKEMSELIVWPISLILSDPSPKNLIIGCHCTITSNDQRPTTFSKLTYRTDVGMLALYAQGSLLAGNCLVVIPDYEGYGATKDSPHPYCNRDVTARQVIDGAKFAIGWMERNRNIKMKKGWKSVAVGYSQGGAVAAGVARYYLENNMTGLNLQGAVCGDGPYDPLATLKQYISDDRMYMPVAGALLLKGVVDTNKELKALGCKYEDFVTEAFLKTGIFEWLKGKDLTTDNIQARLQEHSKLNGGSGGGFTMQVWNTQSKSYETYAGSHVEKNAGNWKTDADGAFSYCTVDQCLRPEVIEYFKTGSVPTGYSSVKLDALKQALAENCLTYGDKWMPSQGNTPFIFFHSTRDEVVPACNYESVKSVWGIDRIQGHPYESGTYLHVSSGAAFYARYVNNFVYPLLKGPLPAGESKITGKLY